MMSFTSYSFIFIFLPLSIIAYYAARRHTSGILPELILIISGMLFPLLGGFTGFCVFVISIIVNWLFLCRLQKDGTRKKMWLTAGIVFDCVFLALFKYAYSGIGGFILPIGISFYTFQNIALLAAVSKENSELAPSLTDYLIYQTFFPKLAQGPITMPDRFFGQLPQWKEKKVPDWEKMAKGFLLFSFGLAKKTMLADKFGQIADIGFSSADQMNSLSAVLAVVSYTIQIYFDFSGYSDMAIGIGRMLGLELPVNFNSPYKAVSIADFWDRWHMSLTDFLTHYVYIPLGGSRRGRARTYLNILIVFLVSGIWHGAGYTFVVWGLLHGLAMVIYRLFKDSFPKRIPTQNPVLKLMGWVLTMAFISFSWIFFRASSVSEAILIVRRILELDFDGIIGAYQPVLQPSVAKFLIPPGMVRYAVYFLIDVLVPFYVMFISRNSNEITDSCKADFKTVLLTVVLFAAGLCSMTGIKAFVYASF